MWLCFCTFYLNTFKNGTNKEGAYPSAFDIRISSMRNSHIFILLFSFGIGLTFTTTSGVSAVSAWAITCCRTSDTSGTAFFFLHNIYNRRAHNDYQNSYHNQICHSNTPFPNQYIMLSSLMYILYWFSYYFY